MTKAILSTLLIMFSFVYANGQVAKNSELHLILKKQDSIFFERGFNLCDFEYLNKTIHKDLIFFHDQSGIQNRDDFMENTRKYICANQNKKPIRKVDQASLEVYPLYKNGELYGAIQNGIHDFFTRESNKPDVHTSRAKFTHVWLLENGNWLLKEVLSFDHKPAK